MWCKAAAGLFLKVTWLVGSIFPFNMLTLFILECASLVLVYDNTILMTIYIYQTNSKYSSRRWNDATDIYISLVKFSLTRVTFTGCG
jgi:hypothetical protein